MSQDSYHELEDLELFDDCTASVDDMFLASIAVNSTQSALVGEAVGFAIGDGEWDPRYDSSLSTCAFRTAHLSPSPTGGRRHVEVAERQVGWWRRFAVADPRC